MPHGRKRMHVGIQESMLYSILGLFLLWNIAQCTKWHRKCALEKCLVAVSVSLIAYTFSLKVSVLLQSWCVKSQKIAMHLCTFVM